MAKANRRIYNADMLWGRLCNFWQDNSTITIGDLVSKIPLAEMGLVERTYDFSILTLLSTNRRSYLRHHNPETERIINEEVITLNRKNNIWKDHLDSTVSKA